jgi:hypothetical protein
MATAFDGVGMGMLGSEKRFMTGDNALADAFKGLKTGLTVKAIGESGLGDFLTGLTQKSVPPPTVQSMGGILGTTGSQGGVNPYDSVPSQLTPAPAQNDDSLHQEFNINKINSQSLISPDLLKKSDQSDSQAILAQANQPVAPPGGMNLPQYGKRSGGGGGQIANIAMKILPMIFGV